MFLLPLPLWEVTLGTVFLPPPLGNLWMAGVHEPALGRTLEGHLLTHIDGLNRDGVILSSALRQFRLSHDISAHDGGGFRDSVQGVEFQGKDGRGGLAFDLHGLVGLEEAYAFGGLNRHPLVAGLEVVLDVIDDDVGEFVLEAIPGMVELQPAGPGGLPEDGREVLGRNAQLGGDIFVLEALTSQINPPGDVVTVGPSGSDEGWEGVRVEGL